MLVWEFQSRQKAAPLFRWLDLDTISPNFGQSLLVIIKARAAMPGMFAISLLFYFRWILVLSLLQQNNNCRCIFVKWMECEAISFNDVRDKICMTAITVTMCSTAHRQGPETTQTGSGRVCPGYATGFMSLTCPVYCQHRRHVCLVSILELETGHTSHDRAHSPS